MSVQPGKKGEVIVALMLLAKERLVHRETTARMLSCYNLIDILRHELPARSKNDTNVD
ncbi:MAG: hypothetical protein U0989_03940 [Azonexus sp.]|nr:hypothetical protein [Azonexus sp.]MDZ4313903.1 hypothetical protein [Azonexus sp.]